MIITKCTFGVYHNVYRLLGVLPLVSVSRLICMWSKHDVRSFFLSKKWIVDRVALHRARKTDLQYVNDDDDTLALLTVFFCNRQ